jgi:hypothetical protein
MKKFSFRVNRLIQIKRFMSLENYIKLLIIVNLLKVISAFLAGLFLFVLELNTFINNSLNQLNQFVIMSLPLVRIPLLRLAALILILSAHVLRTSLIAVLSLSRLHHTPLLVRWHLLLARHLPHIPITPWLIIWGVLVVHLRGHWSLVLLLHLRRVHRLSMMNHLIVFSHVQ